MAHANSPLTILGRLRLIQLLESGVPQAQAADMKGISRPTVCKWWRRYREEGVDGLQDRSSRPKRTPHAVSKRKVRTICKIRRRDGFGPHRIAYELGMAQSLFTAYSGATASLVSPGWTGLPGKSSGMNESVLANCCIWM